MGLEMAENIVIVDFGLSVSAKGRFEAKIGIIYEYI